MGLNPEVEKQQSGFRPRSKYLSMGGSNPESEKLNSGFRSRGQYLSVGGLNPAVKKLDSGFFSILHIQLLIQTYECSFRNTLYNYDIY